MIFSYSDTMLSNKWKNLLQEKQGTDIRCKPALYGLVSQSNNDIYAKDIYKYVCLHIFID